MRAKKLPRGRSAVAALTLCSSLLVLPGNHASAAAECSVDYRVNQWNTGFTANATPISFTLNGTPCTGGPSNPGARPANPYVGAKGYLNPDYVAKVNALADSTGGTLGAAMRKVGQNSTAVWMDRIGAITAGRRPAGASGTTVDSYVNSGRIDRRLHRGNWCNQVGAGIGAHPRASPRPDVDAYVWIKPPGESDGIATPTGGPNEEGKQHDPNHRGDQQANGGNLTGAMPGAPHAGEWFPEQFTMLIKNAYPAL